MESPVLLAALAIVASCVGALTWVIKRLFVDIIPTMKEMAASLVKVQVSLDKCVDKKRSA